MFYVYAHINPITLKPFYIGKGKDDRLKDVRKRSPFWNNYANKYGFIPVKLVDGLSDKQAQEIEKQYIQKYGFLKSGGLLVNLTKGGDGGNTYDPINNKNWNSGKKGIYSQDTIQKIRESRLGKKLHPDVKEKVLIGLKKAEQVRLSKAFKVKCLVTKKVWINRSECIKELNISLSAFKQRVLRNRNVKGYHLVYLKN